MDYANQRLEGCLEPLFNLVQRQNACILKIKNENHLHKILYRSLDRPGSLCTRVQYKKVTSITQPTAIPQLCCYQTYFSLLPILFGKHFSAYLSGLMNVER
jgi:hypothetical protein